MIHHGVSIEGLCCLTRLVGLYLVINVPLREFFPFYIYLDLIYLNVRFFNVFFKEINSSIFYFIFLFICVILAIYCKQMFESEVLTTAKLNKIKQDTILKIFGKTMTDLLIFLILSYLMAKKY